MHEKEHVLSVLEETEKAIKKEDVVRLKELSNQTIHSASIEQDTDSIMIAVIIYSISKVLERTNYQDYSAWKRFINLVVRHIGKSIFYLRRDDEEKFSRELKKIRNIVSGLTGNFKRHVQSVFEKAMINKASRIYEHGISLEKTARILGITMFELAEYAGNTGIGDINLNMTLPVKDRIKIAEEIFR